MLRWLTFCAACALILATQGCTKAKQFGNRVVLNVDGHELKASTFADGLATKLRHLDALTAKDPDVVTRTKDSLVRDFIIGVITERWAKANQIFVRAEDLEAEIELVKKSYPDANAFDKSLAEQNLTFKEWRDQVGKNLLQKLVARELAKKIVPPSEEELKSYYNSNKETFERPEQIQIRQIVLATEADAKTIDEQLKKGRSIADLAEKHSITPEGKTKKGVVGWIERGVLEAFDAGFSMRIGQRSGIVKTPYGYHIFEVVQKRPAQTLPYEQLKDQIRRQLIANREQAIFTSWLETELRKTRVLKDDELISHIRVETRED